MSVEYAEARKKFDSQFQAAIAAGLDQLSTADIEDMEDMEEEIEEDLLSIDDDSELDADEAGETVAALPTDAEVMSYDRNGEVLSRFGDPTWVLIDKAGRKVPFTFGLNHESRTLDFTDPMSTKLALAEKLLLFTRWPSKNLTVRPLSPGTLRGVHKENKTLLDWMYRKGFFLIDCIDEAIEDRSLVTAQTVRMEIRQMLDSREHYAKIRGVLRAVKTWLLLGAKPYCPDWFKPVFSYGEVVDDQLVKEIATYVAKQKNRWEAIPFDDLEPLFTTAKNYIERYVSDLFWLESKFVEALELRKAAGIKGATATVVNKSITADLYNSILSHSYQINPETKNPWFAPTILITYNKRNNPRSGEKVRAIALTPFKIATEILVGAATFTLFTFTAGRHIELSTLKIDALRIDGKPLDYHGDVFAQVEAGTEFDLTRTLLKMKPDPTGKSHMTPIPKIIAKAFVVLIEVFRHARTKVGKKGTCFLFPAGGIIRPWYRGNGGAGEKKFFHDLGKYLRRFCEEAGVDYHHPHKCRKTLATLLIHEDPGCLDIICWILGHNSLAMTMEYIMALPGISKEVFEFYKAHSAKNILQFVGDTLEGHVAGAAGNRSIDAVLGNVKAWKGKKLASTMEVLLESYKNSNFTIHRTPAAWCIRFPTRVPLSAPCLSSTIQDAIANGEIVDGSMLLPRHEHCIPWKCGDAGHTRDDLDNAKKSLGYAMEKAFNAGSSRERAHYQEQVDYWKSVAHQLEYGRPDIVGLHLLESYDTGK